MMHSPTVFPGEDAPGTGLRHFPEDITEDSEDTNTSQRSPPGHLKQSKDGNFQYKTTKQCYEEFPAMVHSGFLLHPPQAGQSPLELEEGFQTGQRRRPAVVDLEDRMRPRIPGEKQSAEGYLRELLARRGQ
ncbi:hypothetical protein WJX79_004625 [Trebouxia sp. C0005]|nr:MAG: hypothetical protein FRX49_01830 [Trebouxia sp. A1-2]